MNRQTSKQRNEKKKKTLKGNWNKVSCFQISNNDPKEDVPYSFFSAFEQGFFSDLTLRAENGKEVGTQAVETERHFGCVGLVLLGWFFVLVFSLFIYLFIWGEEVGGGGGGGEGMRGS